MTCNNDKEMANDEITIGEVTTISPTSQAIYDAGKALLIDSVSTGREFCKFMIGTCMSAIPIYLAIVKFVLPEKYNLSYNEGIVALVPALLFLASGIIFVIGYFPKEWSASLDIPAEIERERSKTVQRRQNLSKIGFIIFCLGVTAALWISINFLKQPPQKQIDAKPGQLVHLMPKDGT